MNNIIEKIADRMLSIDSAISNEPCPISIVDINKWEWAQGVGLYGLYRYYETSGNEKYLDYLKTWFDARIKEGLPAKNINTCCPLLTFSYVCCDRADYKQLIEEWAEYLMNDLPRTEEGGFAHCGSGVDIDDQLWDDTIFMSVLFLARAGVILGREDYLEETKKQFLLHIRYLADVKTGLWFHGWNFADRTNFAGALWGRGNCWITVAIPDYIDIMGDKLEQGIKEYLLGVFTAQVKALKKYQAEDGMWHTLVNDPTSYKESSATAGFAYGIHKGVRLGYIGEEYAECAKKGIDAIISRTDESGVVGDVSYGTACKYDLEYYKNIRITPMTYGQALAILCISEGDRK
ncbi:MAG: glycoside hydrolase family 88 protein [Clostridia bacterium]|nr:glycoside hydrolase family 88 protein [Clostridia bacterium]